MNDVANLTNVLLIAVAGGAILVFGFLASQRVIRTGNFRVWIGAALIAIPGLVLGWFVTQPSVGVQRAYGEISEAILGEEPPPSRPTRRVDRPQPVEREPVQGRNSQPSLSPSTEPEVVSPQGPPAPPPEPSESSSPPEPTSTETPSPSPSPTTSETPSPTPSETPTPTPSPTEQPESPPPPPEPAPIDDVRHGVG
jgi:hypothetical protein